MRRQRRRKQRFRIGMQRVFVQLLRVGVLHNLPQIHHRRLRRHIAHGGQVVGNQQVADIVLLLQILQQVHHLRPDGHIQRRHRLVQHNQLGVGHQRRGYGDALPLPAAELVRVVVGLLRVQADLRQHLGHPVVLFAFGNAAVDHQRLRHDVPHPHPGAQRRPRILEHGLHRGAVFLQAGAAKIVDILAVQQDFALGGAFQAQQQLAGGGLAAARFPHQAHGFPLLDGERDAVHRLHIADGFHHNQALGDREVLFQPVHFQQGLVASDSHRYRPPSSQFNCLRAVGIVADSAV